MLGHGAVGELALGQIPFDDAVVVNVDVSDALLPFISDEVAAYLVTLELSSSDTLAVLLSEAVGISALLSLSDDLLLDLDDLLAISRVLSVSDTLAVLLSEFRLLRQRKPARSASVGISAGSASVGTITARPLGSVRAGSGSVNIR